MGSGVGFTQLAPEKLLAHGGRLSGLCRVLARVTPGPEGTKNFPYTCQRWEKEQGGIEQE